MGNETPAPFGAQKPVPSAKNTANWSKVGRGCSLMLADRGRHIGDYVPANPADSGSLRLSGIVQGYKNSPQ